MATGGVESRIQTTLAAFLFHRKQRGTKQKEQHTRNMLLLFKNLTRAAKGSGFLLRAEEYEEVGHGAAFVQGPEIVHNFAIGKISQQFPRGRVY
jgi:hypothetical protein